MEWGIHLPQLGRQASREAIIRFAQRAEELGVHSGWVSDHIAWPQTIEAQYPYSDDGSFAPPPDMPWLDTLGTLFFVAGCTERLRLGTTVLILGYRPPMLTAKALASLDFLSGGRAILGVGVGWMQEEFDILGMPFDHRGARADEQLELFQALFTQSKPSYHGRYYDIPDIGFEPKPVNGSVPIWVGGDTEPAFRRTARYGSAFHAAFEPIANVERAWARVRELAGEAGRDADQLQLSVRLYLDPAGAMPAAKSIAGSAQQMADTVGEWAGIGVSHILLAPVAGGGLDGRLAAVEQLMSDVAPLVG